MGQVLIHRGYGQSPATTVQAVSTLNVVGTQQRYAREDHVHAGVPLIGVSNLGNTAGNTGVLAGRLVLQGDANITLNQLTDANNNMTVLISGAAGGGGGAYAAGMSNLGNTAGTSGTVGNQLVLVGSQGINLSQSVNGGSATVTMLNNVAFGASNVGNTSGDTRTTQQTVILAGSNNVTIQQSTGGASDTLWVKAGGTIGRLLVNPGSQAMVGIENGTVHVMPLPMQEYLAVDRAIAMMSLSISTSSNSSYAGVISMAAGIYSLNGSTLSQLTSGSTHYQFTNTSNNSNSVIGGARFLTCPLAATLPPGDYWLGLWMRTSSTNANWWTMTVYANSGLNNAHSGVFMQVSALSQQSMLGSGRLSVSSATLGASMALSDIHGGSTAWRHLPVVILQNGTR